MDRKYSSLLLATILCFISLTSIGQVARTDCRPNGYVQTFGNGSGSKSQVATYWFRDGQGRLVTDSLRTLDSLAFTAPHTTVRYSYNSDSVIGIGNDGRRIVILLNSNGLPLFTNDPANRILYATYDDNGFLVRVSEMRDSLRVFIDNIVYRNGNIVSYREPQFNDTKIFTYYKSKFGNSIYDNQKPFALRSTRIFVTYIDVQAFSKNLLKSVITKTSKGKSKLVSFIYKFDKRGRVLTMKRIANNSGVGKSISDYKFMNPCN